MSDVVNIIAVFTALNEIDEIDMEAMFTMYLNTLIELLDVARQICNPPRPLSPLIIFNLDDQNVWSNHMIRVGFRFIYLSFTFINEIVQILHCSRHPSRLQCITFADAMGHWKQQQSPRNRSILHASFLLHMSSVIRRYELGVWSQSVNDFADTTCGVYVRISSGKVDPVLGQ